MQCHAMKLEVAQLVLLLVLVQRVYLQEFEPCPENLVCPPDGGALNRTCLNVSLLCDGVSDCPTFESGNSSDEGGTEGLNCSSKFLAHMKAQKHSGPTQNHILEIA